MAGLTVKRHKELGRGISNMCEWLDKVGTEMVLSYGIRSIEAANWLRVAHALQDCCAPLKYRLLTEHPDEKGLGACMICRAIRGTCWV